MTAPTGVVSLLVRNGDALAMRPGLRGDGDGVEEAFEGTGYLNRIGVRARADRLDDLTAVLTELGMPVREWYGVRVLTDTTASDAAVPEPEQLGRLCSARRGVHQGGDIGVQSLLHGLRCQLCPPRRLPRLGDHLHFF